jgi:transcriptional regulator with XRE-family HTH domain
MLRERHWPERKLTQFQLAEALGVSVPSISAWESRTGSPTPPPNNRLSAYATFFATRRSIEDKPYRVLGEEELTDEERVERDRLHEELFALRYGALPEIGANDGIRIPLAGAGDAIGGGTWYFPDQRPVTIVCARLPVELRERMPYADPLDPDYVRAYTYADLDALIELHGHIRAVNPASHVRIRTADALEEDDYTDHLVLLGGVDWNPVLRDILRRISLPVRQHGRTDGADYEGFFEVGEDGHAKEFAPELETHDSQRTLIEDVAHFFRGANPYNLKRTVTICNGLFGRGTYGAVRALTDARFRDRNEVYLRKRFAGKRSFSMLARVPIANGEALTPDWSEAENRLHEWPEPGE